MKFLIFILCCILFENTIAWKTFWKGRKQGGNLGQPNKNSRIGETHIEEKWFDQDVDHFSPTLNTTWKQRYFVNDEFYKPGGPVFLMIGGESEASEKWMKEGAWIGYAQSFSALCFQLEHRYYGKSRPTNDLSTSNLMFLALDQVLADLASFISEMNNKYNLKEGTKWIALGGSYAGSLAAWLREKYPHLVHGAVSTSGPLLAKVDFFEYYNIVAQSLATYSDNCVEQVQKGVDEVEILMKHMIGQKALNDKFKLCDPIENSIDNNRDIESFFENIASNFADVVQYNKDNSPHAKVTIDEVCDIMTNSTIGSPVMRLAEVNALVLKANEEECLDYKYQNMIEMMKNVSWDSKFADGARQWTYQTCTEFGFYQTSETNSSIFGGRFNVDFFIEQCSKIFTSEFNKDTLNRFVKKTNLIYGGLQPHTTNVIYVHGSIDPWHALGLTSSKDPEMPTIYIQGTAHCANMYQPKDDDPPQLVEARKKIEQFISDILKKNF